MKRLFSYQHSFSKKLILSVTALVIAISFIFSIALYTTTMYILNDYVKPQFTEKLQIISEEITQKIDPADATAAEQNDKAKAKALHEQLAALQDKYNVVTVYILNKINNEGNVVVMSDLETTNLAYPFTKDMETAMNERKKIIGDIYTDEYGTVQTALMPIEGTDMLAGVDINASFIQKIQNIVIIFV
jgi:methyl-accepting chemotaxis protein